MRCLNGRTIAKYLFGNRFVLLGDFSLYRAYSTALDKALSPEQSTGLAMNKAKHTFEIKSCVNEALSQT